MRKWPAEHWHLAFQGQLRTVSEADAKLLRERIAAASKAPVGRDRVIHERHFTLEQANALLPRVEPMLRRLREARDRLTDSEAHELLATAAPANGGGGPGRAVGEAFLEVRELLGGIQELGIVVRDIDRGLIDFPAILDSARSTSAGSSTRSEIGFWHDLESGYGGRRPLDP